MDLREQIESFVKSKVETSVEVRVCSNGDSGFRVIMLDKESPEMQLERKLFNLHCKDIGMEGSDFLRRFISDRVEFCIIGIVLRSRYQIQALNLVYGTTVGFAAKYVKACFA